MIVVERMYRKYPHADPSELTRRKQAIVSNATLGWLSVVDLELAIHIQHNSQQAIPRLILQAMDMFKDIGAEDLLNEHWEYHPAKFLADVVESIIGAIFVDVGHDYEATKKVVIPLIQKVLVASDTCRIDCPIMELMAWAGSVRSF
jgi:endoribonuclease Dicer